MADGFDAPEEEWSCGWESHRHAQAVRLAALPFSAKLEWLEQAQRLAVRLGAAPKDAAEEHDRHLYGEPE